MKKLFSVLIVSILCITGVFALGSGEEGTEGRVVTMAVQGLYANESWFSQMNEAFEAETGIHVDVDYIPGDEESYKAKVNINLMAGSDVDVIESIGQRDYSMRVSAGFFLPLNEAAENAGLDPEAMYGANLPVEADGSYYGLPYKQDVFCVFYNKNLFDQAGIPYPEGPWTWDEYIETAKKLTDPEKGIYGSFMPSNVPYYIFPAIQRAIPFYTEDGLSNFDSEDIRSAAEWFKHLCNDLKIQPTMEELQTEGATWNYFAVEGYRFAMFPQGNWFTRLLNSQTDYPRDWQYGIAPLPSFGEDGANNLSSASYVSVNKNAAHMEEALIYALWIAENQWKYENGIPAFAEMTEEEQQTAFGAIADASDGQVTVEDLYLSLVDNGMGSVPSDIIGTAAKEYTTIIKEEILAYNMDIQTLDEAVANIVSRANESIQNTQ